MKRMRKINRKKQSGNGHQTTRREFIKRGAIIGGGVLAASQLKWAWDILARAETGTLTEGERYELSLAKNILQTVCLQCNTGCPIKVRILDGVAVKIDGNPYAPWTIDPHLPYKTPLSETPLIEGALCPKGQAGIQSVYDPYRFTRVLKRAGPRGSDKWVSIPFDQAVSEIVEGGTLFSAVKGEGKRNVIGLRELYALKDPAIAKKMGEDIEKIRHKEMTVEEFKTANKENLHLLIDPDHPDLGPKNNQFVFWWGRLKAGRSEFINRFAKDSFGTTNAHGHTTVCQGSLYFSGKAMSEQYQYDEKGGKMKWTGGKKFYWQGDLKETEFALFVGASPFEANYGPSYRSSKITEGLVSGRLKIAVADPRLSKTAAHAWKWLPIRPGTEAALGMAMIRWIIENKRYDSKFLSCANKASAKAAGEPSWTNACWLVKVEKGEPGAFLRGSDLGLPKETRTAKDGKTYEFDPFVAIKDGKPVAFDPYDETTAVTGDLLYEGTVNSIPVKTGLQVLFDASRERSMSEWADVCGLPEISIVDVTREFTSHGKKAVCDIHRGVSQHTNGFYNVIAFLSVNLLIGNYDWKGGMVKLTTYDQAGEKEGKPFNVGKLHAAKTSPFGISIIRHDTKYEESTLFAGYPAKRPWFPLASDIYQEVLPSAEDGYPYPIKALFLYMGTPAYALPAGQLAIKVLTALEKVPLFVAFDIVVGETSMYADYIFPDLTYLERWEFHGSHPSILWKVQPVRQPVIAPLTENVKVFGEEMPISLESTLLSISEKMGLPGFGKDGFGPGRDFTRPEDLYLREVANIAFGDKADGSEAVPEADDSELALFIESRRHLPKAVFDPDRWKGAVGDTHWKRVIYVLNRGGRFEDYEKAYEGDLLKNKYASLINLYGEKTAKTKSAVTGKNFAGYARYYPLADISDKPLVRGSSDLNLITYREIFHTKSRTVADYWLLSLLPENSILINTRDANTQGLSDGDKVRLVSDSNPKGVWDLRNGTKKPIVGKLKVIEGIRPGVVAFSLGHGHWAYGSADIVIDGKTIKGDPRRSRGVHANAAMAIDPFLKNTCLQDPVGASVSFYDSPVRLIKA